MKVQIEILSFKNNSTNGSLCWYLGVPDVRSPSLQYLVEDEDIDWEQALYAAGGNKNRHPTLL